MPLNPAALDVGGEAIAAALSFANLFTAVPNAAGTNFITGVGRADITMLSTDGNLTLSAPVDFTGGTPTAAVNYIGFYSGATGGTFYGYAQRTTGDPALNASGEYTVQSISIPATAS